MASDNRPLMERAAELRAAMAQFGFTQAAIVVDDLMDVVKRLPVTADGVPVAPGVDVYNLSPKGNAMAFLVQGLQESHRCKSAVEANTRSVGKCYSTAAAALASARDAGGRG